MRYARENRYERYRCRAQVVILETVYAESPEEAERIFEARLDALEDDDPGLRVEGMWVD